MRSDLKRSINYFTECPNIYANCDENLQKEVRRASKLSQLIVNGLERTAAEFYAAYAANARLKSASLLQETMANWDIEEIGEEIDADETEKNFLFDQARKINVAGSSYQRALEEKITQTHEEFSEFLDQCNRDLNMGGNLSVMAQDDDTVEFAEATVNG